MSKKIVQKDRPKKVEKSGGYCLQVGESGDNVKPLGRGDGSNPVAAREKHGKQEEQ